MFTNNCEANLKHVVLTGEKLSIEEVINVAINKVKVSLATGILDNVIQEREMLIQITESSPPIYGVTRAVGANKNVEVPKDLISEYQTRILLSHCIGIGPYYSEDIVRAIMVTRANSLAKGGTGVQPEILEMYVDLLNHQIHPLTPSRSSIGASDLGPLAEMGLTFIGKGRVIYQGEKKEASEALSQAGLTPITLGPKDGLILCSNNSVTIGHGTLILHRFASLLEQAEMSFALSLEAFCGNVTPLHSKPNELRCHQGQLETTENFVSYLKGSYLWDDSIQRSVQDPLSYRTAVQVHGACRDILNFTIEGMNVELNSVGDNPLLLSEEGRLISHGNFNIQTIGMRFDFLGIQASSLSNMIQNRIQRLMTPEFSGLPKFLTSDPGLSNGFSTLQKTYTSLAAEIRHLANPGCLDALPVANSVEDHGSMAPFVIQKTEKILENLEYMVGIELMVSAQAIDLREPPKLGEGTQIAYNSVRNIVPKLTFDRVLSNDIEKVRSLVKKAVISKMLKEIQNCKIT